MQLYCTTKLPHVTLHVTTATNHTRNVASNETCDDILASMCSLVLVGSVANQKLNCNLKLPKKGKYWNNFTIGAFRL